MHDHEEWVELAEAGVDSPTGSQAAADLVAQLRAAGIEAQEKPYVPEDPNWFTADGGPDPQQRVRFAVLVHRDDHARASCCAPTPRPRSATPSSNARRCRPRLRRPTRPTASTSPERPAARNLTAALA